MNGFTPTEWELILDVLSKAMPLVILVIALVAVAWKSIDRD